MDVQFYTRGQDVVVAMLRGNLDSQTSEEFTAAFEKTIQGVDTKVIIDCGKLDYISSLGLATLIRLHSRLKRQGGQVLLANVGGLIGELLRTVRLDQVFGIHPDIDAAHAALQPRS